MEQAKSPAAPSKSLRVLSNSNLLSSPPRLPPPPSQAKERRNPSITPRKFRRFFTPRSRVSSKPSAARRALRDLTAPALNRCQTPSSPLKPIAENYALGGGDDVDSPVGAASRKSSKRRKMQHTPPPSSPLLGPPFLDAPATLLPALDSRLALLSPLQSLSSSQSSIGPCCDDSDEAELDDYDDDDLPSLSTTTSRPTPLTRRGMSAQLIQRMAGGLPRGGHRSIPCPVADWKTEVADFCTSPDDAHLCLNSEGTARRIPFCTASCKNNSLVAVGDEEGHVRLLDSNHSFSKTHLSFRAHSNAIIDLDFSHDDYLLATASGDQTGKVIDMMTQTPISILGHHTASLKQVRFQPGRGEGSVLATSGRDGSIQIWDLRCRGGPVQDIVPEPDASLRYGLPRRLNPGCVVNSIYDAHCRTLRQTRQQQQQPPSSLGVPSIDVAGRGEVPGRAGEVSVTALQFLPAGREHLILSACEADASVKLWDIRSIHTSKHHKSSTPVSYTSPPDSHTAWRPFGISSIALGSDGARLYALCKDNTVYAYSTAHLVLGHAPELAAKAATEPPRRRARGTAQEGLGPLYGFRHPQFHATSFYVKAGVRPARDGRSELLAVGSSDGCAVLFPTDERYFRSDLGAYSAPPLLTAPTPLGGSFSATDNFGPRFPSTLSRTNSATGLPARLVDTVPIVRNGAPLVRGHDKEVGALCWTSEGRLVTVGDDFLVRCWSESRDQATSLRRDGEAGGRRWACGWADVGEDWDGDGDDW